MAAKKGRSKGMQSPAFKAQQEPKAKKSAAKRPPFLKKNRGRKR